MNTNYHIKVKPIYYIPVIIFVLSLAVFFTVHDSKRIRQLHADFHALKNQESVSGYIEEVYTEKGACFITLDTGTKISVPTSRNYKTKSVYLDRSLNIGDSLYKHKDSDTLFLNKGGIIEFFVIGEFINNAP
jgi:hypothetical protein